MPLSASKKKVLFIIHDLHQNDVWFPMGPAYLAAMLFKNGAQIETYCMDVYHYTNEDLAKFLDENEYQLICLGFMAARFKRTVRELCYVICRHKKNAWLVLGGYGPSSIPEFMLPETGADIVVAGEAEYTILDLLNCKINKLNHSDVNGIAFLKNGRLIKTPPARIFRNLDELPLPLWEAFPMEHYTTCLKYFDQEPGEKVFFIETSRGCTAKCNFCDRLSTKTTMRLRSIENIISEFQVLHHRYGVTCFLFLDELFIVNRGRLTKLAAALKNIGLRFKFSTNVRSDTINEERIRLLKECGCNFLNFGFESTDDNVLQLMSKGTTNKQNVAAVEAALRVSGMGIGTNFLWNNFGDNQSSLLSNQEFIKRYNTYHQCRTIEPAIPYPGSPLYYDLIRKGLLKDAADFFERFLNQSLIVTNLMENISTETAHLMLFETNSNLVRHHYRLADKNPEIAKYLIKNYHDLYTGKTTEFKGARHLDKEPSLAMA